MENIEVGAGSPEITETKDQINLDELVEELSQFKERQKEFDEENKKSKEAGEREYHGFTVEENKRKNEVNHAVIDYIFENGVKIDEHTEHYNWPGAGLQGPSTDSETYWVYGYKGKFVDIEAYHFRDRQNHRVGWLKDGGWSELKVREFKAKLPQIKEEILTIQEDNEKATEVLSPLSRHILEQELWGRKKRAEMMETCLPDEPQAELESTENQQY